MTSIQLTLAFSTLTLFLFIFGYLGVPLWAWSIYGAIALTLLNAPLWLWVIFGVVATILNISFLRSRLVTAAIFKAIRSLNLLPSISNTEKAAIEAGTVWVDGEYFSGKPNLERIHTEPYPDVSPDVQAFLDGPVEQVCRMTTDWEIHRRKDLPPDVWEYLKQERFFGMMIPKEYDGLGFTNLAYSAVMAKLASRSFIHTATVGVTNSLGPAKLLLHYGTDEQKNYYLPRLAKGEEIPCFALTEPMAGSDAASITSNGVVFRGDDGKLYLRLNLRKRYITLGAIATLIGLAFKLQDPENLLGKGEDVGITCALVPANTPGMILGRRHDPMGVPFYNSPIEGRDVVISVDQIIGGAEQAGQGWKMLMQSLAAGRGISFPASCTGIAKLVSRVSSAHSVVRRQFGLSIGKFEGIEEPLARIASLTYVMEAARLYTLGAVDRGEKPSVISAIAKYQFTELARRIINDGMDILGGSGICRGPRNLLANIYIATPIPVTVEGANIITRTMMIYGQGVIRCHPYLYDEIQAISNNDVHAFDHLIWNHIGLVIRNIFRTALLNLSRGRLAQSPVQGETARYYQKLAWASATFALLTDFALVRFGGSLKRQEAITGRFADILSWLYLGSATLRRFEAEGQKPEDLPLVHWSMQYAFAQIQQALEGIVSNLPIPTALRSVKLAWVRVNSLGSFPSDQLGHQVVQVFQTPGEVRDRLTSGIYLPEHSDEQLGLLEQAFSAVSQSEAIAKTVKSAVRAGKVKPDQLIESALSAGIISDTEASQLREAETLRQEAIQVDSFTTEEYFRPESPSWQTKELMHH
jgi:acyl-CoA dehydrogenase